MCNTRAAAYLSENCQRRSQFAWFLRHVRFDMTGLSIAK